MTGQTIRKALISQGLPVVKVKRVSFSDLARAECYVASFSERRDFNQDLRALSKELGVRVIQG